MRKAIWIGLLLSALAAIPCSAQSGLAAPTVLPDGAIIPSGAQDGELFVTRSVLIKHPLTSGKIAYDLRVEGDVDVSALTSTINPTRGETPDSLLAKIDAQRRKLYPDREIVLTITPPKPTATVQPSSYVVKGYAMWNYYLRSGYYWYVWWTSDVATIFVDEVKYGSQRIYYTFNGYNYYLRYTVPMGGAYSLALTGAVNRKGYMGYAAAGYPSQADVVMWFFK